MATFIEVVINEQKMVLNADHIYKIENVKNPKDRMSCIIYFIGTPNTPVPLKYPSYSDFIQILRERRVLSELPNIAEEDTLLPNN